MEVLRTTEIAPQSVVKEKDTKEFFDGIKAIGLDMDDTTIRHDPRDLSLKFAEAVLYDRLPQLITPGKYTHVLDDIQAKRDYVHELGQHAEQAFNLTPAQFYQSVAKWVAGTVDREDRRRVVEEDLHFETEEHFWNSYAHFGELVPRDPKEYLVFTPGAKEFLTFLHGLRKSNGLQIHLVSNSKRARLEKYVDFIQSHGFEEFDSVVSARDDIGKPKPAPDSLISVASKMAISTPENTPLPFIYVGNGDEDVLASASSGWTPVIINSRGREFSSVQDPHFRFRTMKDFHAHWLKKTA